MGALAEYVKKRFGVETHAVTKVVNLIGAAAAAEVLKEHPDRLMWTIINLSVGAVYLGPEASTDVDEGIWLDASGGSITMIADEDGELVGYRFYGYAAADAKLFVIETIGS